MSDAATGGNPPLPLRLEGCSGTADVAECGGVEDRAATRKIRENNDCSGVADFRGGTDGNKPAELPGQSAPADAAMADAIEERAAIWAGSVRVSFVTSGRGSVTKTPLACRKPNGVWPSMMEDASSTPSEAKRLNWDGRPASYST